MGKAVAGAGKSPRLRARWWPLSAVPLGAAAVAGWLWLPGAFSERPGATNGTVQAAQGDDSTGDVLRVEAVHPSKGGIRRVTVQPGSVHSYEWVDLYSKVSGFLKVQKVDIGSAIHRGDVLAEIDAPELFEDVEEAQAQVEESKAQVKQAEARIATAEAEQQAASAAVAEAQANIERYTAQRLLSEKQFERIKGLHAASAVDRRLMDEQQRDLETAQAAERSAKAAVVTAQAQLNAAAAKVSQARADLAEARATLRVTEARLARKKVVAAYTRIAAPFDGVVTKRNFHPGAFIQSAADGNDAPLLTVMRTDLMRVVVQVPDTDVAVLDVGDPANITIDALKGQSFRGKVARLARAEDPTTRTMRVEIDLPNPDGRIGPGMYARVTIELQPVSNNLTIPLACLAGRQGSSEAMIVLADNGKARRKAIQVGEDNGVVIEVVAGLSPGDTIVVRPGTSLPDGTPLNATIPSK